MQSQYSKQKKSTFSSLSKMYAKVKLLNGFKEPLIYKIPDHWLHIPEVSALVKVPLRARTEYALIEEIFEKLPTLHSYIVREIVAWEAIDNDYHQFITKVSNYYALEPQMLYKRLRNFFEKTHQVMPIEFEEHAKSLTQALTADQQAIVDELTQIIKKPYFYPALLHGVTGSGKTEIYKALMHTVVESNKSVLFMVPEVPLAIQFTTIFKQQFNYAYGFHSACGSAEKKKVWQVLHQNIPSIIIGVHLPILLPLKNLGLIIIDEEHDQGYQEKQYPRINSREIALIRAQQSGIPILLGSATPSLSSLHAVKNNKFKLFSLTKRFQGEFPKIQRVTLAKKNATSRSFWISPELEDALADRLHKQEQSIIFLNRRGHSFFLQCLSCKKIMQCPACSVSLTVHEGKILRCHYCEYNKKEPDFCPTCQAPEHQFLRKGIGTQQMVTILTQLFPQARIDRTDLDTTVNKKKWQATMQAFKKRELDILVGTQSISKGYHFPGVTLVGLIWADINLGLPIFQAAEITLQQIIQVAGRAGRQSPESLVIVQTMADHELFTYINEIDYLKFYEREIEYRKELMYPPYYRLAEIELRHTDEHQVEHDAQIIAQLLIHMQEQNAQLIVLGPAKPMIYKINNIYKQKIILKAPEISLLLNAFTSINKKKYQSDIFFTPNPQG